MAAVHGGVAATKRTRSASSSRSPDRAAPGVSLGRQDGKLKQRHPASPYES
jgi:hypothetical protein